MARKKTTKIGRPADGLAVRAVWSAQAFRVARARLGISMDALHEGLVEKGVSPPTPNHISQRWNKDGGPGPSSTAVVRALAQILKQEPGYFYRADPPRKPQEWQTGPF